MATKFGFVVLGLLCLVPNIFAAPQPPYPGYISFEELGGKIKGLSERIKLSTMAVIEFAVVHRQIKNEAPKVFNSVLKDPSVSQVQTAAMNNLTILLRNFVDLVEGAESSFNPISTLDIVDQYNNVVDKFDERKQGNLSHEAAIIERSLKANGLDNIQNAVRTQFESFIVKINAEVDEYIKGLNAAEKEYEKDLIDWHHRLNAEQDLDKKIEIVKNLPSPSLG